MEVNDKLMNDDLDELVKNAQRTTTTTITGFAKKQLEQLEA